MSSTSPCIDICRFDSRTGWCEGCGRTIPEVRSWRNMRPGAKRSVNRDLAKRLQRLRAKAELVISKSNSTAKK